MRIFLDMGHGECFFHLFWTWMLFDLFCVFVFPILTSICLRIYSPKAPPLFRSNISQLNIAFRLGPPNSSSAPLLVTISLPVFLAFHGDGDTIRVSGELSGRWILAPNTCQALPRMLAAPVTTARGFLENAKRWYFYRTMKTGAVAICIEDVIWSCRQRFKVSLVNCPFSLGQNTSPSCRF